MHRILILLFLTPILFANTLDEIKARGVLRCGVHEGLTGFSQIDETGLKSGFDVDFCRAISAAIFNDPNKVEFIPLNSKTRFLALSSKQVDVLARNSTWTLDRDSSLGISFSAINFYDGQAFMVPKALGVSSIEELDGAVICVNPGTTTELNLADYFQNHQINYKPVVVEGIHQALNAYENGRCDAFTADLATLSINVNLLKQPDQHMILKEVISKEPLALAVASDDDNWRKTVAWIVWALINAEELGITHDNIEEKIKLNNPKINRLLGEKLMNGMDNIGLDRYAFRNMIDHVGNYGEIFDRNLGKLNISRGNNNLWTKGGLLYAPPVR